MNEDFTLLLLSQYYPVYQKLQILSCKDIIIDADVAGLMSSTEQQVSSDVLKNIYAYAAKAVQRQPPAS